MKIMAMMRIMVTVVVEAGANCLAANSSGGGERNQSSHTSPVKSPLLKKYLPAITISRALNPKSIAHCIGKLLTTTSKWQRSKCRSSRYGCCSSTIAMHCSAGFHENCHILPDCHRLPQIATYCHILPDCHNATYRQKRLQ